jgi:glutathione S-transferase
MSGEPLLLIGMLDSPFVRRVAIALELYSIPYQNLPLRTVGDAAMFATYSPLRRAPTLKLPSGELLCDSHLILAHLDEMVPEAERLWPAEAGARLLARQVVGVAAGVGDKAVHGVYERVFHSPAARSSLWLARIRDQLRDATAWLDLRAPEQEFLFGSRPSHADIVVGTTLRFAREAHPEDLDLSSMPRLQRWVERLERLPVFQKTYLALEPPSA